MTKAQIHFSNHLEELLVPLKEKLFPPGASPFDRRLIAVPHIRLKDYLMQALAKDPELRVAAGVQIVTLPQALTKLSKKNIPTKMELSLFLQYHLLSLIDTEPELTSYFNQNSREKRIGPFSDVLAEVFLRYAFFGKPELPTWQEKLWKKFGWTMPTAQGSNWQVHLFGFSFIPQNFLSFFEQLGAQIYLFSPCEIFWGDFYSEKEITHLEKKVPSQQLDLFVESFRDQNPLLASFGRMGRQMLISTLERNLRTREYYVNEEAETALSKLQTSFLFGTMPEAEAEMGADRSLTVFSAATPLREMEILKDTLLHLFDQGSVLPSDVQVFAPDISKYAPFIEGVFGDLAHSIYDIPLSMVDAEARAFAKLIDLPKKRFALGEVLAVLASAKFELDIGTCRKWLEAANVRWGFSKEQRKALYLEDMEEVVVNPAEGTWAMGLKRLLLGLGNLEGDEDPLAAVSVTEIEAFNTLYSTIESLADDLSPLSDGTCWTMSTWFRYFACLLESYISIEPSHDLYKGLLKLASSCDHLDQEEIPYAGVERILSQLLSKKNKAIQAPHLQAVQFSSFSQGAVQPCKVICVIGLQEEVFPRREDHLSLFGKEATYRPTKTDEDRYLFLQALLSARKLFQASYVRDPAGKLGASLVLEELLSHLKQVEVVHHPAQPYDPEYFGGDLVSYSQENYTFALEKQAPLLKEPLIPDFFSPTEFSLIVKEPQEIEIQKLLKFAKHPLRYYFHEVLGIYPDFGRKKEEEYLLSPLLKSQLVRASLSQPIEEVLQKAEKKGELPVNLLKPLAKQQVSKEVREWQEAMRHFSAQEMRTEKIDFSVGDVRIFGKIDGWTERGILVKGKNTLEDRIRFWPLGLVAKKMGLPLLPIKEQEPMVIEGSLEEYIDYFLLAKHHPSPLLPAFANALIEGTSKDLHQELKKAEDEIWGFLYFRDPMPSAEVMHANWSPYLRTLFERVDAKV